jgi:hypothetical protein
MLFRKPPVWNLHPGLVGKRCCQATWLVGA